MTHWTNELNALTAGTLALIATVAFGRKRLPNGRVVGRFLPNDAERAEAAANQDRLANWCAAVGSLLRRHAAVSNIHFHELAKELAELVALTYESEASLPVDGWRERTASRMRDLATELAAIVDRALPEELVRKRTRHEHPIFELRVEPSNDSWHLLGHSPLGKALSIVTAPAVPTLAWPYTREPMKLVGRALFEAAFPSPIGKLFADTLTLGQGASRIHLRPEGALRGLPWELLHDGRDFLSLSTRTPVSRVLDSSRNVLAAATQPLRLLVTTTAKDLDNSAEVRVIRQTLAPMISLGLLRLDVAENSTLNSISRLLRSATNRGEPYHVWHFIGHGVARNRTGATELIFPTAEGDAQRANAEILRTLFRDHPELHLVVLNCCLAGRAVSEDAAVAAFLDSGVPAVIAMQREIPDDVAIAFAEEFYGALVDGADIDDAVTEARRAIYFLPGGYDWMTPVLFLRRSVDSISL